ncbi:F-actin-capping protein subunit alpha, partial [Ananas comosus]
VIITPYGELDKCNYFDPRTMQVATVDHMKQVCTKVRAATDEELPSSYVEEFRIALDNELVKYVSETYPKGICAVYCTGGNMFEGPGADFGFAILFLPLSIAHKFLVGAHYFEEGNVQLDANNECKDSTIFQSPEDCAISITNMIRHRETEYMTSLEASYLNLPDTTFKDLRRKLPVTRTLFPWHSTFQFSLNRDLAKDLGIGK